MKYSTTVYGNLQVTCPIDCGNAPKKSLLKDLNIALAKKNVNFIFDYLADDFLWDIVGDKRVQGKDKIADMINEYQTTQVSELHMSYIITHGKTASANGIFMLANKKSYAFCHVYNFTSAGKKSKLKEMTTYLIETPSSRLSY